MTFVSFKVKKKLFFGKFEFFLKDVIQHTIQMFNFSENL